MKHFNKTDFCALLKLWDSKHRILGKTPPEVLYDQSVEALRGFTKEHNFEVLIDVGAGNGILGIPALIEGLCAKVVLVEPLPKKVAFLEYFKSVLLQHPSPSAKNVMVAPKTIENVSRETLEGFAQSNLDNVGFVVRAFSGSKSLNEAFGESEMPVDQVYDFFAEPDSTGEKYVLRKVQL